MRSKYSLIREIRGKGLMLGIELTKESYPVFLEAFNNKLIINSTHLNVLRIMPALNITRNELDKGLEILDMVFRKFHL
jgi:acetylornithine/N-succinyldiaminopimelate aminotransferase